MIRSDNADTGTGIKIAANGSERGSKSMQLSPNRLFYSVYIHYRLQLDERKVDDLTTNKETGDYVIYLNTNYATI